MLSLEGGETAATASGLDAAESTIGILLPKSCGDFGIIHLEEGVTYHTEKSNHSIPEGCHTLQGAPSSRILLYTGIRFASERAVIRGPLQVTMAPGVESISTPAFGSTGNLRAVSPKDSTLEFNRISTSAGEGAALCAGSIQLDGEGTIIFEKLSSLTKAAAAYSKSDVNITVTNLHVRNVDTNNGSGAIYGRGQVYVDSGGTILFENCTCDKRGAGIASIGLLRLSGDATYVFERCSSGAAATGTVTGGGALSSFEDVVLDTNGSVVFKHCRAGGYGGAIYSGGDMNLTGGNITFQGCQAAGGYGHAIAAGILTWPQSLKLRASCCCCYHY